MPELHLHLIVLFGIIVAILPSTVTSNKIISIISHMENITDFFKNIFGNNFMDESPEFITTFDIVKLMDKDYAKKQFYCLIQETPCDEVGLRIKASVSEDLLRNCNRCSVIEKKNIERIIQYVQDNFPTLWDQVLPFYKVDP